ncbi:hypothetical protein Tco_0598806 [Tanacetum coccineum]
MGAPVISISSEESVGSHAPRVILFGAIPAIIPVIPKVPVVPADPIDSLPPTPDLPLVSPFLCSDDTEANEFPLAPVVAPPGIRRWPTIPIRPGEAIPFGRLYRTTQGRWRLSDVGGQHLLSTPYPPTNIRVIPRPTLCSFTTTKRFFRDSYSPEDSGEEHMEVDTADAGAVTDIGISEGVVAHPEDGVGIGFEIAASDVREDDKEFKVEASAADTIKIDVDPLVIGDSSESSKRRYTDLKDTIYDIVHYMSEVRIDRISGDWRPLETVEIEEFRQVSRDRDDTRRRLGRLESYVETFGFSSLD